MENRLQNTILDSITEGVFTVDSQWRITFFNRAAERITGISRQQALGQRCKDILRADICEQGCALRQTMETGKPIINHPVHIVDAEGHTKAISITTALLRDSSGTIEGAVETFRDTSQIEELRKELQGRYSFEDILSRNHKMQDLFAILPDVAESSAPVLIVGESGTGKELLARALHNLSPRGRNSFIAVNCAALPDTLLESELFGYKAGAFTDAKKDKPGRFELAQDGTIFLDELADISSALQVRLLRVLQEKTYEPLGATSSMRTNARVIAATNKDIDGLVKSGQFRDDLFYRINVIRLSLPPLRDRKEDIPLLVDHFIGHFNSLYNKSISAVSDEVLQLLLAHDYPGNIRQLENIIEHCFVICQAPVIERRHLPGEFHGPADTDSPPDTGGVTLLQMEKLLISEALRRNDGNRTAAAEELGIHKTTLFRKLKQYGIS